MMRNSNGMGRGLLIAALVVVGLAVAGPAYAITFQLTGDHCTGTCGTPPFGTVDVTQNGANVNITVTLAAGNTYAQTGAADGQIFKFNGVGVALGDIVVGAHVPALVAATGAFNGDGTGNFTFGINCPSCGNGPTGFGGAFSFTVNNATIADVTQGNTGGTPTGIIFVADILGANGNTGPVFATGGTPGVPEPASLLLLGAGLAGLGIWRRKSAQV